MATRQREIDSLRARIQKLEQMQEQEAKQNQALEATKQSILDILEQAGLSFEAFIRHNAKAVRRIVAKIEREEAKAAPPEKRVAKKTATKKRRRKAAKAKKPTIKIPTSLAPRRRYLKSRTRGPGPRCSRPMRNSWGWRSS